MQKLYIGFKSAANCVGCSIDRYRNYVSLDSAVVVYQNSTQIEKQYVHNSDYYFIDATISERTSLAYSRRSTIKVVDKY